MIVRTETDRAKAIEHIRSLNIETHPWEVTGKPLKKIRRSDRQNNYLWGVVYPAIRRHVMDHLGATYSTEEIHEWCKERFIEGKPRNIMGDVHVIRSTKTMSKDEFGDYIGQIFAHFAEQGLVIPDPDPDLM